MTQGIWQTKVLKKQQIKEEQVHTQKYVIDLHGQHQQQQQVILMFCPFSKLSHPYHSITIAEICYETLYTLVLESIYM